MAKRKPFPYKKAMKALRGKVPFNYDLRKSLNSGQKAAIRRAWNDFRPHKNSRYLPIKRHPGETEKAHINRIRRIQNKFNLSNPTKGLLFQISPDFNYRIMSDRIVFTHKSLPLVLTYVPHKFTTLEFTLKFVLRWREKTNSQRLNFVYKGFVGAGFSIRTEKDIMLLIEEIQLLEEKYEEELFEDFFSGFLFRYDKRIKR